jgi:23S rRNA pseudouridine2605 synthase
MERLQKVLARAGIASRRAAEQIILAGRVRVDGRIVRELGTQVDERRSRVEVDGNTIVAENLVYLVLHKPRGVVCTLSDPEGRPTIRELLKGAGARVVPVGRLDFHTSGALLCTNDGEFAQALAHPTKEVPKVYVAKVKGAVDDDALDRFGDRIMIDGRPTQPAQVKRLRFEGDKTWLEVTLREGRNRQVRRLGEATGFPVMRLARISHAGVTSEDLRPGQWRPLTVEELVDLKKVYGVPKKVRAPQFEPAPPVKKGQRRPARPDIHGEIHDRGTKRAPRGQAAEARSPGVEVRDHGREERDNTPNVRAEGRRAGRGDARPPRGEERTFAVPRGEGRGVRSEGRSSESRFSRGEARPPRGEARFSKGPPRESAGVARSPNRKAPLQSPRGPSPRHDDVDLPWKERSRSAIERRVATNSPRPSAERGSGHAGRKTSWAERGGEKDHRGPRSRSATEERPEKNRRGRGPASVQDAKGAGRPTRSAEANHTKPKPYAPRSAPRRGTSR